ncbi:MAG: hypothetical protein DHS20C17_25740 [Cyclobacteriaceae bacterium]|nr:MAG: hypothetical protein DHS20C17_25740 [Cyclobacteriaceae bacterium]
MIRALIIVFGIIVFPWLSIPAQQLNGFDISEALIPSHQILRGGPPRDGIPAIDNPKFKPISQYREFDTKSQVLGIYYNGIAKAYPITIMDYHEIVNDDFNGKPVVATYCPLCGSGIAFEALVNDERAKFGVSGLLYNSDVLLYDRSTESLWSQIMAKAVSGSMKGQELTVIPTRRMSLGSWKKTYPESLILTTDSGFERNYQEGPYGNYNDENITYFPVSNNDDALHKKEWIIGIEINGQYKAYPIVRLSKVKTRELKDSLGGTSFTLMWDTRKENFRAVTSTGKEIPALQMFWFAWVAFHPETALYNGTG